MKPIWKRSLSQLTPKQRHQRDKSLKLADYMRKGLSLAKASELAGIDIATARKNTDAFYKTRTRWRVKKEDQVSRPMVILENGRRVIIEIIGSRIARQIGEYHSRVKQYVNTYNEKYLKLRRKTVKDSKGKRHRLETRPLIVIALKAKERHPEFFNIYAW